MWNIVWSPNKKIRIGAIKEFLTYQIEQRDKEAKIKVWSQDKICLLRLITQWKWELALEAKLKFHLT